MLSTSAFVMPFFNTRQHSSALQMQVVEISPCYKQGLVGTSWILYRRGMNSMSWFSCYPSGMFRGKKNKNRLSSSFSTRMLSKPAFVMPFFITGQHNSALQMQVVEISPRYKQGLVAK